MWILKKRPLTHVEGHYSTAEFDTRRTQLANFAQFKCVQGWGLGATIYGSGLFPHGTYGHMFQLEDGKGNIIIR